ncbi:MAG: hypothetical protein HYU36_07745 [Planctomycetes bacterium]|nr:hypothetical protein [Planctomycetota bacterium]
MTLQGQDQNPPLRAWVDLLLPWPTVAVALTFGLGMALVWAFALRASPWADRALDVRSKTARGRILPPIESAGWSVNGRASDGGIAIYRYTFSYEVQDRIYQGISYSTGLTHQPGEVEVEYLPDRPAVARVRGTRLNLMDRRSLLLAVLPVLTLPLLIFQLCRDGTALRLVRRGRLVSGHVLEAWPARSTSAGRPERWNITYEFETEAGEKMVGREETAYLAGPRPGEAIDILYLPRKPRRCRYLGEVASRLEFDASGRYETRLSAVALLRLSLFALSLGGHALYALWKLGG